MAEIVLESLGKIYPDGTRAVGDVNLTIFDGEFLVLVGPSGCGKSTVLRMIAGLEEITEGTIHIGGTLVNDMPPKDRDIAMVFQNYALYPHMSVFDNMAFGLKLRKMDKDEIKRRVEEAAATGDLRVPRSQAEGVVGWSAAARGDGPGDRAGAEGLLMDEPLSNLDAKLRVQMRTELGRLHARLKTTTVYVTHDQVEAMTLGHRVAVLKAVTAKRPDNLQQVAPPSELFYNPANLFVAGFIGSPAMNMVNGHLEGSGGEVFAVFGPHRLKVDRKALERHPGLEGFMGKDLVIGIRPGTSRTTASPGSSPSGLDAGLAGAEAPRAGRGPSGGDPPEGLGGGEAGGGARGGRAAVQALFEVAAGLGGVVGSAHGALALAAMTEQGCQLALQGGRHVLPVVRLVGGPQQQGAGTVGGEAGGDLLGEEEVVAGGHHAVHAGQAGHAVVGVQLVALPGVVAQDHVGAHAAHPLADPAAQGQGVLELAVGVVEESHLPRAEGGGRLLLLGAAGGDEIGHGDARVPAALGRRR